MWRVLDDMLELQHQVCFLMPPCVVIPGSLVVALAAAPVLLRLPEEELRVTVIGTRFERGHFTPFLGSWTYP